MTRRHAVRVTPGQFIAGGTLLAILTAIGVVAIEILLWGHVG